MDTASTTPSVSVDTSSAVSSVQTDAPIIPIVAPPAQNAESKKSNSWGAVASIIVILLLVSLAALYMWGERISQEGGVIPSATEGQ